MKLHPQCPPEDGLVEVMSRAVGTRWGAPHRARRPFAGVILTACPERRALPVVGTCPAIGNERGVALVITLIMLAVISTLAIAFLGLTQRETGSVDAMSRTTDAEVAADSALERAKAEVAAVYPFRNQDVAANGPNIMGPDMMVSVCCQDYDFANRRAIPYDRLNSAERVAKRFDSAPPVFVQTNPAVSANSPLDDRFFLDLNRNGVFEDTGNVLDTTDNPTGTPGRFQTNNLVNWRIGDPQWIGVLQNPRRPHTNNNRFIGRYAFMVLPAGKSLDVNWIHNEALDTKPIPGPDTFYRNQGVGGWEANLAGFLCDLNTNYWGDYRYDPYALDTVPNAIEPGSAAFNDAREIFGYRFPNPLQPFPDTLTAVMPNTWPSVTNGLVDVYGDGPLSFGDWGARISLDNPAFSWPGAESRQRFFSAHDFWDGRKLTQLNGFTNRLTLASTRGNSYDRYTFYRMLSQLGADSIPEDEDGKIHLNYVNVASWDDPGKQVLATDYISWTNDVDTVNIARLGGSVYMGRRLPEIFFLSAVTNILAREFPNSGYVTNNTAGRLRIPVCVNGTTLSISNNVILGPLYSARIHLVLQQVANILDAMILDDSIPANGQRMSHYPSVFRPIFEADGGDVYIVDYKRVVPGDSSERPFDIWSRNWRVLPQDATLVQPNDNVFGIPIIFGARSGFPNFNEFAAQTTAKAVRRLHFYKDPNEVRVSRIEQQIDLTLANEFSVEVWNSSDTNVYPRVGLNNRRGAFLFGNRITSFITNNGALVGPLTNRIPVDLYPTNAGISTAIFGGYGPTQRIPAGGFVAAKLPEQVFLRLTNTVSPPDRGGVSNQWSVTVTNNVRFFMVETNEAGEEVLVDAVSLGGLRVHFDIGDEWASKLEFVSSPGELTRIWDNSVHRSGLSLGVTNQISISRGVPNLPAQYWEDYSADATQRGMTTSFDEWFATTNESTVTISNTAPFSPYRVMVQTNLWQANDPLVHYTSDDLDRSGDSYTVSSPRSFNGLPGPSRNPRSIPWGGQLYSSSIQGEYDAQLRDSSVAGSDYWKFPDGPFANVGWLGRVHRGTPWQTIYFKSAPVGLGRWKDHSGRTRSDTYADSIHPIRDWRLLDYFTTTIHPNASRGRLSINQSGLAAWSAVLSGVMASTATNQLNPPLGRAPIQSTNVIIGPAGVYDPADLTTHPEVVRIVDGINKVRNSKPNREFSRLSEILAVPELSFLSPCLTNPFVIPVQLDPAYPPVQVPTEVSDSDYERLPEQILGLLKVGVPRFVVYAWGQSLKPARLGFEAIDRPLNGPSIDPDTKIVNNYQVTGEVATRAVVRVVFPERESNNPTDPGYFRIDYKRPRLVVESFNIIDLE